MVSYVENNLNLLETLKRASPELREAIILHSDADLVEAISEICHNYIAGNIDCEAQHKEELSKHKNAIRALARGRKRSKSGATAKSAEDYHKEILKKKQILLQRGEGFFDSVLLPLMKDLSAHFLDRIINGCKNCRGPTPK